MELSRTMSWLISFSILVLIPSLHALDDIYNNGKYEVDLFDVAPARDSRNPSCMKTATSPSPSGVSPPKALLVAVPKESGTYPVVHLQHAFTMKISFYTQFLEHVASHGFIVVAAQMPLSLTTDATMEIAHGASVLDWYPNNLENLLGEMLPNLVIKPDLNKIVLAGHSRGGKVAFGLATGVCKSSVEYVAIAGLDPVDGTGVNQQTTPKILPNKRYGLDLPFPTLVVGAGLGPLKSGLLPSCAPLGVSHANFFNDSAPLAYHFVAPEYGHMDYLDDKLDGLEGLIANNLCKNGPSREPMRKFTGGILVAFMNQVLFRDSAAMSKALLNMPSAAPVTLERPEVTENRAKASF